jgi:hypothetical protein
MHSTSIVPIEEIEERIFILRGQRVMIDNDLARLYGVETKYLNRQVKRNAARFPDDFMFQLTTVEKNELVTNWHRFRRLKHSTGLPYAFTEHGVAMLSAVLKSERAILMSILVVKAFVRLREIISRNRELSKAIELLEAKVSRHDTDIQAIVKALRQLMQPPEKAKPRIGF